MKPIVIETSDDNILSVQKVYPYIGVDFKLLPAEIVLLVESESITTPVIISLHNGLQLIKALHNAIYYSETDAFLDDIK